MEIKLDSFYKDLTPDYINERREEVDNLKALVNSQNWIELKVLFHRLAGSAGSYGLQILTDHAAVIEDSLEKENFSKVESEFAAYLQSLDAITLVFLDEK